MPALKTYDLFISHAWKYGEDYDRLVKLLNSSNNFYYRNYSAPEDKPLQNLDSTEVETVKQIKESIIRKISPVNCVLVISGMYFNYRRWMKFELDTAVQMGKPIIGIKPYGNVLMASDVSSAAKTTVNWNTDSIVSAIRTYSL
jgi:hypothetical protein